MDKSEEFEHLNYLREFFNPVVKKLTMDILNTKPKTQE